MGNILSRLRGLLERSIVKQAATLMTGTVFGQLITVCSAPFLTRLYSPNDFGIYALFSSVQAVLLVMTTGRYELAVVLPDTEKEAVGLVYLCLFLSVISSCMIGVVLFFYETTTHVSLIFPDKGYLFLLLPLSLFFTAIYQTFYYLFNRKGHYRFMSSSRVIYSVVSASVSFALGLSNFGYWGLITGFISGQVVSTLYFGYFMMRNNEFITVISIKEIYQLAKRYSKFPRYLIAGHMFNSAGLQVPVFMLTMLFGSSAAGFYSLAQRSISVPLGIIAKSVSDVFRQKASDEYKSVGNCLVTYNATLKLLALAGSVPFVILTIFAPSLFTMIFGDQWAEAGSYVRALSMMFFFQLISSPLSVMYIISENQRQDLLLQIYIVVSSVISFFMGWYIFKTPVASILLFAINSSLVYIYNIFVTKRWAYGCKTT